MQEKTKLYVDKNTPNVDKNTPNVDKKGEKKGRTTMKNTAPPRALRGQGLTGAAPPTATDISIPLRFLMAVADKKGLLPRAFDCLNQGANLSRLLLRGNP